MHSKIKNNFFPFLLASFLLCVILISEQTTAIGWWDPWSYYYGGWGNNYYNWGWPYYGYSGGYGGYGVGKRSAGFIQEKEISPNK